MTWRCAWLGVAMLGGAAAAGAQGSAQPRLEWSRSPVERVSLPGYGARVRALETVVAACAQKPGPGPCDPEQVGPDAEVTLESQPAELRRVSFSWLRETMREAASGKGGKQGAEDLQAAEARLRSDAADAGSAGTGLGAGAATNQAARGKLEAILKQREFRRLDPEQSLMQKAWAELFGWLFRQMRHMARFSSREPWLGRVLLGLLALTPCVGLVWWMLQPGRRKAMALPAREAPDRAAPSARAWQQWRAEAETLARQERWREAVHHVYWAAISRLESRGLWKADRARTPREYLRLLGGGSAQAAGQMTDLRTLTDQFERIWYGHRRAEQPQYEAARALMERLAQK